jgi:hypothetical protein
MKQEKEELIKTEEGHLVSKIVSLHRHSEKNGGARVVFSSPSFLF